MNSSTYRQNTILQLKDRDLVTLSAFLALATLCFDLITPSYATTSIGYVTVILLINFHRNKKIRYGFVLFCSLCIIVTAIIELLMPDGYTVSTITNKPLSLMTLWLVFMIGNEHKNTEQKLMTIIESSPSAMVLVDSKGKIRLANKQMEILFGYESDDLVGQKVENLLPARFRPEHPKYRNQYFQSPSNRAMGAGRDLFALHSSGTEFQVEIGLNPMITQDGIFVVAAIIDITERKKISKEIEDKNSELEALLYIASHDLKEPLRSITYFSQSIVRKYQALLDEKGKDHLSRIINSSERMSKLLDDINLISKARRIEPSSKAIDTRTILNEVIEGLQAKIDNSKASIHIANNLPKITIDPFWLSQSLFNLISNSLKFVETGKAPEIEIDSYTANLTEGELGIVIRDRGIGVNPAYAARIFGLFQRAVGREIEGTGMGLAIVKTIVEQHGGRVWVEERLGGGSEFIITFKQKEMKNENTQID
jgi:PAS domain S-box-containing protein